MSRRRPQPTTATYHEPRPSSNQHRRLTLVRPIFDSRNTENKPNYSAEQPLSTFHEAHSTLPTVLWAKWNGGEIVIPISAITESTPTTALSYSGRHRTFSVGTAKIVLIQQNGGSPASASTLRERGELLQNILGSTVSWGGGCTQSYAGHAVCCVLPSSRSSFYRTSIRRRLGRKNLRIFRSNLLRRSSHRCPHHAVRNQ